MHVAQPGQGQHALLAAGDPKALVRFDLTLDDMDVIELNEAFAAQTLAVLRGWQIEADDRGTSGVVRGRSSFVAADERRADRLTRQHRRKNPFTTTARSGSRGRRHRAGRCKYGHLTRKLWRMRSITVSYRLHHPLLGLARTDRRRSNRSRPDRDADLPAMARPRHRPHRVAARRAELVQAPRRTDHQPVASLSTSVRTVAAPRAGNHVHRCQLRLNRGSGTNS